MKFIPKAKKYTKIFKFRLKNEKLITHRTFKMLTGSFGLKAKEPGF